VTAAKKSAAPKKAAPAKKAAAPAKKSAPAAKKAVPAAKKSAPAAKKAAAPAKKSAPAAKKAVPAAKKSAPAAKKAAAPAKKAAPAAKKAAPAAKKAAPAAKKAAPAAKKAAAPGTTASPEAKKEVAAKKAAGPPIPPKRPTVGPYAKEAKFLEEQRVLLLEERETHMEQSVDLRAEADSLALEREPGDVQFDEESGEGGTVTVDRERNLALSVQAGLAVEEIDDALKKIERKTYGDCERCHQPIPKARLRALPFARLCVACKSGGLSRR
jgi:RNA polymerase-binding transcription factor DksA